MGSILLFFMFTTTTATILVIVVYASVEIRVAVVMLRSCLKVLSHCWSVLDLMFIHCCCCCCLEGTSQLWVVV